MATDFRLHIDPADVLGVSRDATSQEIRDAYRSKAKRYHPDAGGEEWAFHILAQAYEILTNARVAYQAARQADPAPSPTPPPRTPPPRPRPEPAASRPFFSTEPPGAQQARPRHDPHETVRPGVHDPAPDPAKIVDVEKVTIRYEPERVWLITDRSREGQFLSSCLNITWPDPELNRQAPTIDEAEAIIKSLGEVFDALEARSEPISARSSLDDGRFTGWLSFRDDERANAAFVVLRELLHGAGLVVKQWSRDLVIPRQWR